MREPPIDTGAQRNILRITPAYAGTTYGYEDCNEVIKDHPRVCGNHKDLDIYYKTRVGSPPRMREPHDI